MKAIYFNQVLSQIAECERLANIYNSLYQVLSSMDFDKRDFSEKDRKILDAELEAGQITSLAQLGERFDQLADAEYRKANILLKKDFKKAI
jgi:hypothetical protein